MSGARPTGRPHALYVAWGFPPMAAGGTFRTLATANVLADCGFDVTVLTTTRESYLGLVGIDDALIAQIDQRIEVVRIPFAGPARKWDIRRWTEERAADPVGWQKLHSDDESDFPEPVFGGWHEPLLTAAERIHAKRPVDLVLGSANPHVVLSAGHHLHRLYGVPYVIDHRDAWRLNHYRGTEAHVETPEVAELETRFVSNAHEVWFVNEAIRTWHQRLYPEFAHKMRVVENGYDEQFSPRPQIDRSDRDGPIEFTYVGNLTHRAPVEEFVEGWIEARRQSPMLADAVANLYGPLGGGGLPRKRLLTEARRYGVFYHGPVSKTSVAKLYENSDVLLLILPGGQFVTSGKVYEYLSSALPIASVHAPDNGAGEVLAGYPLWSKNEDLTAQGVAEALISAAKNARTASQEIRAECSSFAAGAERRERLTGPVQRLYRVVTGGGGET